MSKKHTAQRDPEGATAGADVRDALQAALTRTAEAIEERREAFVADPADVETIHRFRTNSRALRSLVAFLKPWQDKGENAETQAILKEIVGHTSLLRELDVFEAQVRADEGSSAKLVAFCKKEAASERAKVLKALTSKRLTKSFKRAMEAVKHVTWRKGCAERGLASDVVRARFDALIASVSADLAALDLTDEELTHDVRKRAKRARYVAERTDGLLGADAVEIAKRMNAHQDVLGEVCDARANIRLIGEFLGRDLPKSVARDLKALKKRNEALLKKALEAAETTK